MSDTKVASPREILRRARNKFTVAKDRRSLRIDFLKDGDRSYLNVITDERALDKFRDYVQHLLGHKDSVAAFTIDRDFERASNGEVIASVTLTNGFSDYDYDETIVDFIRNLKILSDMSDGRLNGIERYYFDIFSRSQTWSEIMA